MDRPPTDPESTPRPRSGPATRLALLGLAAVVVLGALAIGGVLVYREVYSPTAFARDYLVMLSEGRAAEALRVPGVAVSSAQLEAAGLPATASDALLRGATLAGMDGIRPVSAHRDGAVTTVTMAYTVSGRPAQSTFQVVQSGWIGIVPTWRFAQSPLAVLDVVVRGSMRFSVNGFEVDKRQVSMDGVDAAPLDAVPMLVFSPGAYRVSVDTAIAATPGAEVVADEGMVATDVELQAEPTAEFVDVVQERVEEYLDECATQEVLQPTGCPFGYVVQDRIEGVPTWSITQQPTVEVIPEGADWVIPPVRGTARIAVTIVSLFDGSVSETIEDVPFSVYGQITVLPDGTASIRIGD